MIFGARIERLIGAYATLGERYTPSGVRLIGRVPHRGPQAYLHVVFPPAPAEEIARCRRTISAAAAFDIYAELLAEHNGAIFFLGALALFGLRNGPLVRSAEERQPFDLAELNRYERPRNADPSVLFVGSYNSDGSLIFVEPSGEVFVCRRRDATPYARWSSLEDLLDGELMRINQFYDGKGQLIDRSAERTPPPTI